MYLEGLFVSVFQENKYGWILKVPIDVFITK